MELLKAIFNTANVTGIIALTAIISPILVAIVNNLFNYLTHKSEIKSHIRIKQLDIYYSDKRTAFGWFVKEAVSLVTHIKERKKFNDVYSAFHEALLLCNEDNKFLLLDFLTFINDAMLDEKPKTQEWEREYVSKFSAVTNALNKELSQTSTEIFKQRPLSRAIRYIKRKFHI